MGASESESRADVLAAAAAKGVVVTADQLVRWHRAGLIPKPAQHALGRGRGTESRYPVGTSGQVVALWRIKQRDRRLDRIAVQLWWDGFPIAREVIRNRFLASAAKLDTEIRAGKASSIPGPMRRRLGRRRTAELIDGFRSATSGADLDLPLELAALGQPPSLDVLSRTVIALTRSSLAGTSAYEIAHEASDEDLDKARDWIKSLLTMVRTLAEPLAWLYGNSAGSVFRLVSELINRISPTDIADLMVAAVVLRRTIPTELLAATEAVCLDLPFVFELRATMAIRDSIPGAKEVVTAPAVRALLRGKEAGTRHSKRIERFASEHRREIETVVAQVRSSDPVGSQPV